MNEKMKFLIKTALSKFNLRLVKLNKFDEILEDAKYRAIYEVLLTTRDINLIEYTKLSKAERFQDVFVIGLLKGKKNGYFVEFGAADGLFCSNTYMLENEFGWTGILAEPAKVWHQKLYENRRCNISEKCVYESSDQIIEFSEIKYPGLSTITKFKNNDNHAADRVSGEGYNVKTISLNDLLMEYEAPDYIDYMSIDTEGSEYEIISRLDFKKYKFGIVQIEHNNNKKNREKIRSLMYAQGYKVIQQNVACFDDFFCKM